MKNKYTFPTKKQIEGLKKFIAYEKNKDLKQIENASKVWLKAHWENKMSYEVNWLGMPIIQTAEDMVVLQEIVYDVRPDFIVETGIAHGGSLIYFASLLELLGKGKVIGIDIEIRKHNKVLLEQHPMFKRIITIEGDSTSEKIFKRIRSKIPIKSKILVILDYKHAKDYYSSDNTKQAIDIFMKDNKKFIIDRTREKLGFTYFRGGFLKKIK